MELVHEIQWKDIRKFIEGVKEDDYEFYDENPDIREVVVYGHTNSGKSSLINALNYNRDICDVAKKAGKT